MKRVAVLLACVAAVAAAPGHARAGQCGLPDSQPLWIDFADGSVPFWETFAKNGVIAAASNLIYPPKLRAAGAQTVYWDMYLNNRVGRPTSPADPSLVEARANKVFDLAVESSGCTTPLIAENELFGAQTTTPWSASNAQYRANVLTFLRTLSARGARPFLLISQRPYTGGDAAEWWRQAAQVADLVREVYFPAPRLAKLGVVLGNRFLRESFRQAVLDLTEVGVPVSKIGLMLGFQVTPGAGGRENLNLRDWLQVTKWQALAAKQVAKEFRVATVWSWGWGSWSNRERDPTKQLAACVWLWSRDPSLCDAPTDVGADFDDSRTAGQLSFGPKIRCVLGRAPLRTAQIGGLARMTGDPELAYTALYERLVEAARSPVTTIDVLAAERAVIAQRFGGSRSSYAAALARSRATVAIARDVLADELRRVRIEETLPVRVPTGQEVSSYYETYATLPTLRVQAKPAPTWLGGKALGLALSEVAPDRVFKLGPKGRADVWTPDGRVVVKALGEQMPLGAFSLQEASPAIRAALTAFARDDAFEAWSAQAQRGSLNRVVCQHDRLPEPGVVELASYLPFLAL